MLCIFVDERRSDLEGLSATQRLVILSTYKGAINNTVLCEGDYIKCSIFVVCNLALKLKISIQIKD